MMIDAILYLLGVIFRLVLAPIVLIVTTIQFVITAILAIGRWIFTGRGVTLNYGPLQIR